MEYQKNYKRANTRVPQMRVTAEMPPYSVNMRSAEFDAACSCADIGKSSDGCKNDCLIGQSLAMVYSPSQEFKSLYDPSEALCRGTLFSDLYKPFWGGRK